MFSQISRKNKECEDGDYLIQDADYLKPSVLRSKKTVRHRDKRSLNQVFKHTRRVDGVWFLRLPFIAVNECCSGCRC
jgi:hypothetical protein